MSQIELLISGENRVDAQLLKNSLESSRSGIVVAGSIFSSPQAHAFLSSHNVDVALVGESLDDGNLQGFKLVTEIKKVEKKFATSRFPKEESEKVDIFLPGKKIADQ